MTGLKTGRLERDLYGGRSPVDFPTYSVPEAAHYLELPTTTVRSWTLGRRSPARGGQRTFPSIVRPADPTTPLLSFRNLVELHVLSAIRKDHRVKLRAVRKAIAYLRETFHTDHPLADRQMLTDGTELFIEQYGPFVSASEGGPMALRQVMDLYLKRIRRDKLGIPVRLYPFTRSRIEGAPESVVIDPRIQFGRPCLAGTGIPTAILIERYKAGDSLQDLSKDYGRPAHEIEEAIRYETRPA
jgi:uncharacterized protein (DUF433 family)